jgi:hypothetical protein
MKARAGITVVALLSLVSCMGDSGEDVPPAGLDALPAAPEVQSMALDPAADTLPGEPVATADAASAAGAQMPEAGDEAPFDPKYQGIETRLLDGDLVSFNVRMRGARTGEDVSRYAECAAAQYTLIRGYGFARHVRTKVAETGGLWQADAVYTISESLPKGFKTIDAEVTTAACVESGIPTV